MRFILETEQKNSRPFGLYIVVRDACKRSWMAYPIV